MDTFSKLLLLELSAESSKFLGRGPVHPGCDLGHHPRRHEADHQGSDGPWRHGTEERHGDGHGAHPSSASLRRGDEDARRNQGQGEHGLLDERGSAPHQTGGKGHEERTRGYVACRQPDSQDDQRDERRLVARDARLEHESRVERIGHPRDEPPAPRSEPDAKIEHEDSRHGPEDDLDPTGEGQGVVAGDRHEAGKNQRVPRLLVGHLGHAVAVEVVGESPPVQHVRRDPHVHPGVVLKGIGRQEGERRQPGEQRHEHDERPHRSAAFAVDPGARTSDTWRLTS